MLSRRNSVFMGFLERWLRLGNQAKTHAECLEGWGVAIAKGSSMGDPETRGQGSLWAIFVYSIDPSFTEAVLVDNTKNNIIFTKPLLHGRHIYMPYMCICYGTCHTHTHTLIQSSQHLYEVGITVFPIPQICKMRHRDVK